MKKCKKCGAKPLCDAYNGLIGVSSNQKCGSSAEDRQKKIAKQTHELVMGHIFGRNKQESGHKVELTPQIATYNILIKKVIHAKPATILFYEDREGKAKKIITICSEDDVYSEEIGKELCVAKAMIKELDKRVKEA